MITDDIARYTARAQPKIVDGLLLDHPLAVTSWLSARVMQGELVDKFTYGVGVCPPGTPDRIVNAGEAVPLIAAAAFADYYGGKGFSDITMSAACADMEAITPEIVRGVLAYPFGTLKVNHITAFVDGRNHRGVNIMDRFGFVCTGAKTGARDDGGDVLMYSLTRRTAKYNDVLLYPEAA